MKRILTILFILFSCSAFAQFPNTHGQSNARTKERFEGAVYPVKGLINGRYADTASANLGYIAGEPGGQIVVGNTLYIRDVTKTKWVTVGEYGLSASNITILNDSSISICNISSCDTFKFTNIIVNNFSVVNDSTIIVCDGNNTCDTLHITPTQIAKSYVDSVKVDGSLIYYYINGNAILAGVVGGKDGLISPGIVTWSGSGLKFYISPAQYILDGKFYTSPFDSVTLNPADTQSRVDLFIVDTTGRAGKITGVADGNLVTPQVDPASQIALTQGIQINPGDTIPSQISNNLVYDENLGTPDEWTTTKYEGTFTVDFNNLSRPENGVKSIYIGSYNGAVVYFTGAYQDLSADQNLSFWVYLNGKFSNNMYALLANSSTGAQTNYLPVQWLNKDDSSHWQQIVIPTSYFTWYKPATNFNRLYLKLSGVDTTKGLYIDNISIQKGINSIPPQTDYSNKLDSVFVRNDSLFQYVKGREVFRGMVGSTGNTKYVLQGYGTIIDSSDANHYTVSIDTTRLKDSLYAGRGIKVDTTTYPNHTLLVVDSNYVRDTSLHLDGGTINQVLKKNSSTNGDWSWQDESGGGGTSSTGVDSTNTATTDGQTVFTFPYTLTDYTVSKQVTRNGVLIDPSDYTVNTGDITFTGFTCDSGDKIRFIGVK